MLGKGLEGMVVDPSLITRTSTSRATAFQRACLIGELLSVKLAKLISFDAASIARTDSASHSPLIRYLTDVSLDV